MSAEIHSYNLSYSLKYLAVLLFSDVDLKSVQINEQCGAIVFNWLVSASFTRHVYSLF